MWELYHVAQDPSECNDLAESEPDKLAELIDLWWREAEIHGVLPLDDRMIELFGARFRDNSPHPADRRYVYRPPVSPLPMQAGPPLGGRSWDMTAHVERTAGQNGVLFATGTENSGLSLFVEADHLVFDYNAFDDHTIVRSTDPIPDGASRLGVEFRRGPNRTATATLVVDGRDVGSTDVAWVMGTISSVGASVGYDNGSPVSRSYAAPNPFEGRLDTLEVSLLSQRDSAARAADERAEMSRQ
jgi:arylsulfatase